MKNRKTFSAWAISALSVSIFLTISSAQQEGAGPLKVFLLAGQSNMQGHGYVEYEGNFLDLQKPNGTIDWLLENPDYKADFEHLVDEEGNYTIRDDVWVYYKRAGDDTEAGALSFGYGAHDTSRAVTIGPELGFGWVIGDFYENQVLLIKTAWGGKSLNMDFRPPSSGGTTGPYYLQMLEEIEEVLGDIKQFFPGYDGQGYELAGFGWHQGWNDRGMEDEYEDHMVNFIKDVREALSAPDLPFVIAESGMNCYEPGPNPLCDAQAAAADSTRHPEFAGNVRYVGTRQFYDVELSPFNTYGYHWYGSMYSYYHVGDVMGETMVELLPVERIEGCRDTLYEEYNPDANVHVDDSCRTLAIRQGNPSSNGYLITGKGIFLTSSGDHVVRVFSTGGELVVEYKGSGRQEYGLSGLRPGVYVIRIEMPEKIFLKRVSLF